MAEEEVLQSRGKDFTELEQEIIKFTDAIQAAELEAEYATPQSLTDFNILVIDSNRAICLSITKYLRKLGFSNIKYCYTEEQGLFLLENLSTEMKKVIVFLDLNLPNSETTKIISSIFEIHPSVRIVIVTARERNDPKVLDAFANGVSGYLGKPISYVELKKSIQRIEEDELLVESDDGELEEQIMDTIKKYRQISLAKLTDFVDEPRVKIQGYIDKLIGSEKIIQLENKKEIACGECLSVSLSESLSCPSCNSQNFTQGKLIEHYSCGNVSPSNSYTDDLCPSCHKEITIVGVDHKVLPNYFVCNDCGNKSHEMTTVYQCDKCGNKFSNDEIKWENSPAYKIA